MKDSCLTRDSTSEVYKLLCITNGINIISSYILNSFMPAILENKYLHPVNGRLNFIKTADWIYFYESGPFPSTPPTHFPLRINVPEPLKIFM